MKALRLPLAVFLISRLITIAIALVITILRPSRSLLDILTMWDGGWYLRIAESGYPSQVSPGKSVVAFFPGYPLAIRGVSEVTGISPTVAGIAISLLCGLAAAVVLWILSAHLLNPRAADRAVILFSFFPSAFVLTMIYTEALFILLAATCLLALARSNWLLAGVSAALASATRINGLLLAGACLMAAVVAIKKERDWKSIVAPILAPLGTVAFLGFLYATTGEAFAPFSAQQGWDQRFDFGTATFTGIVRFTQTLDYQDAQQIIPLALIGVVLIGVYLVARWKPPIPIAFYAIASLALSVLVRQTYSGPRYLLSAFPIFIAASDAISDRWSMIALGVSGALMAALFVLTGTTDLAP